VAIERDDQLVGMFFSNTCELEEVGLIAGFSYHARDSSEDGDA